VEESIPSKLLFKLYFKTINNKGTNALLPGTAASEALGYKPETLIS
jgi:hypothetical protein